MNKANLSWRIIPTDFEFIEFFGIDGLPEEINLEEAFEFGGVCVLNEKAKEEKYNLLIFDGFSYQQVEWGIKSPWVEQTFLKAINRQNARFKVRCKFRENYNYIIVFLTNKNIKVPIAEVIYPPPLDLEKIHIEPNNRLIFDIGANDGSDTVYYLMKGFRVVAVEPIPFLYERICEYLNVQIKHERLLAIDKCVDEEDNKTVDLVVNYDKTDWSSSHAFDKNHKAFKGNFGIIKRETISLATLIKRYGQPYYIKLDIEGAEFFALKTLSQIDRNLLPKFISFELLNKYVFDIIELLYELGYKKFQLVRQGKKFLPAPTFPTKEGLEFRYPFSDNMSGSFGEDLPFFRFKSLADIIKEINEAINNMRTEREKGKDPGWYDIHAKLTIL